jgi:ribonuclease J
MVQLTFYGGVSEIGGNKILLEDKDTRLLLDFGISFKQSSKFFSEFLQPRKCNCIEDLMTTGLLPDLKGIYRLDYLCHQGRAKEERNVDAVLISHAHADHAAYIHHLREDIDIYVSPESHAILQALEDTGSGSFLDFLHYTKTFQLCDKKKGSGKKRLEGEEAKTERPLKTFEYGKKFNVNHIEITPYEVDHSLPGATAFFINTNQINILYTGDLRFHGYKKENTNRMVEEMAKEDIDVCIIEGTRIEEDTGKTENNVLEEAGTTIGKTKNLAIVNFPARDLARLKTFHEVSKKTERKLVLTFDQAYLLELMSKISKDYPPIDDTNIRFYAERKSWGLVGRTDYPSEMVAQDYSTWEREYLGLSNTINHKEIRENQSDYIVYCNYFQLKNLIDIKPDPGSGYIRSVCEPFDDEMLFDENRVKNWLDLFSLPMTQIHASGHANRSQLFNMLKEIKPTKIYPIHTNSPEAFSQKFDNAVPVEIGKKYEFK